jgi:hypothetical protein
MHVGWMELVTEGLHHEAGVRLMLVHRINFGKCISHFQTAIEGSANVSIFSLVKVSLLIVKLEDW